jgi:arylsulfatase A-like enzyme
MSQRTWVLAAALLIGMGPLAAAQPPPARPNIVFVLADDAGLGDFGCYGGPHIRTPHIDRLAADGMRFTNAYSGSAVCAPTRCVLMTGQHTGHCIRRANQSKHGLLPLAADTVTVAALLKKAGYATGGFGKWGLGNPGTTGVPEKHGFDVWFGYYDQVHAHDYYTDHLIRNSAKVPLPANAGGQRGTYSHDAIVDETLKFIDANKDRPFFVYAAWTLPHGKYDVPSDAPYTDKPWSQQVKNYAAMVSRLDAGVGRLLDQLKQHGLDERTLVLFSSDNGANAPFIAQLASSAGLRGQKRHLYEGGIRAPFLARWPDQIKPGSTSDFLTSHVDFLPSAAELAGVEVPRGLDGISIVPTLLGRKQGGADRALYWEIYEGPAPFQQAVRLGDWKGRRTATKAPLELYNLKADPAEAKNVAADHADVVKRMEAFMAAQHTPSPHYDTPEQPGKKPTKPKKP